MRVGGWVANLVNHKVRHDKQERRNAYAARCNGAMARPGFNDEPLGAYFSRLARSRSLSLRSPSACHVKREL